MTDLEGVGDLLTPFFATNLHKNMSKTPDLAPKMAMDFWSMI
jgi:hypothetical protein